MRKKHTSSIFVSVLCLICGAALYTELFFFPPVFPGNSMGPRNFILFCSASMMVFAGVMGLTCKVRRTITDVGIATLVLELLAVFALLSLFQGFFPLLLVSIAATLVAFLYFLFAFLLG